jgi:hypothetical protein
MSWENYGSYWHIDHIIPVSSFALIRQDGEYDWDEVRQCWSLANLQPLTAAENFNKSGNRLHLI